jgi:hypothetical protein
MIFPLLSLLLFSTEVKGEQNPFRGFTMNGQCSFDHSFVRSGKLPTGRQYSVSFGGNVGYYAKRMSYFAFFNRHQTVHSVRRGLLLYRDYKGYDCGINVRRVLGGLRLMKAALGVGISMAGNFDKYSTIEQYMAYPSIGSEAFVIFNPFKNNRVPMEVCIPFRYAFRQSGHYHNVGILIRIGICFSSKK